MASSSSSPCAACKFLRRKCTPECVFAPYFPPDQPQKFANVHKIFGASNITKLLNELPQHQREDAVNSLAYEADARVKDPVYGCVGAISVLQRQVIQLQKDLVFARSELARYTGAGMIPGSGPSLLLPGTQQGSGVSSSRGIGMSSPGAATREQIIAREQLMELARDQNFTREQILDYARLSAAGKYDANTFAALGLSGTLHGQHALLPPYSHTRPGHGNEGGNTNSGRRATGSHMGHLSPP
eukprot:c22720_g2_i1 orf=416-1141(+)